MRVVSSVFWCKCGFSQEWRRFTLCAFPDSPVLLLHQDNARVVRQAAFSVKAVSLSSVPSFLDSGNTAVNVLPLPTSL